MRPGSKVALVLAAALVSPTAALAQPSGELVPPAAPPPPAWSYRLAAAAYVLPNEADYVQPTITSARGALHLEGRYNYEDRESLAGFVGWSFAAKGEVAMAFTPMLGGVVGNTDGLIPALELTLELGPLELYSESEYVIDLDESNDSFFYTWSEVRVSPSDWLSGGLVMQRTRLIRDSRDIQRGPYLGLTKGRMEGAAYFFNPGTDDHYFVAAIGVTF